MEVRVVCMPRCPGCGARDRWVQGRDDVLRCDCGDWRGCALPYATIMPAMQREDLECPRGHGAMHERYNGDQRFWLCAVCDLVVYPDGGPLRVAQVSADAVLEARRKAMENTLSWVGRFRRHRQDLVSWLAQGRGAGALAIFGGGSQVSNPTMNRAMQIVADPAIAMIGTRLRQIDGIYKECLDPVCQQFTAMVYFDSPERPPIRSVCDAMGGVAVTTFYWYRATVLDAFLAGLPPGWENPQAWWEGSPLEAKSLVQIVQTSVVS